jgi:hypothetical protein
MKILHWFGCHNFLNSVDTGDYKFEYQSAWDLMITKFTKYKCLDCGRYFYYPAGSFEEEKMRETTYKMTMETVNFLIKKGKYNEAIDILKI